MANNDQQQSSYGGQDIETTSQQHQQPSEESKKSSDDDDDDPKKKRPILDRSLGTAAGLSKLLPTGTTLAFETMAPSFTRGGECKDHDVNFAFTWGLIVFLTLLTAALRFTDSVTGTDGKTTYYGVVTSKRLRLFVRQAKVDEDQLKMRRRRREDALHAIVSAAVFLALAFCDAGVQRCLVKRESQAWKDFFNHLPLAVGFLAAFVFIVFPTTRMGIGEDGALTLPPPDADNKADTLPAAEKKKALEAKTQLGAAATLSKLLPMGTTLAFQTMAPSFTRGGDCVGHRVNFAFTWGLIAVLALLCAALSFTDSVTDLDGHTYYGVATCRGLWLFNCDPRDLRLSPSGDEAENARVWSRLRHMKKMRPRDFLHAVVSPAVFVTVAFCDAGVQDCLVPEEYTQWRQFLALLPLAVAFLASFLFFVFPSNRKGIGEEGDAFWHLDDTTKTKTEPKGGNSKGQGADQHQLSSSGQHPRNQIGCCVCVRA